MSFVSGVARNVVSRLPLSFVIVVSKSHITGTAALESTSAARAGFRS